MNKKTKFSKFFFATGFFLTTIFYLAPISVSGISGSSSVTVTLDATKDAWVDQSSKDENRGADNYLSIQSKKTTSYNRRSLLQFSIPSLPAGAVISSATLTLFMYNAPSQSRSLALYRLNADWVEGNSGTDNDPAGEVTWNNQPATSTSLVTAVDTGVTDNMALSWDVKDEIGAILSGASAYTWEIADSVENDAGSGTKLISFWSKEYLTDSSKRPKLTITYTVPSVNVSPTLSFSTTTTMFANELSNLQFTASSSDPDGGIPQFSLSGQPAGASIDSSTGLFSWTPGESQGPGDYSFVVNVSDGNGGADSKNISVHVNEINSLPVVSSLVLTTPEDKEATSTLTATDADLPSQSSIFDVVVYPAHGTLTSFGTTTGQFSYLPSLNYFGTDSFVFKANDGVADSATSTVSITVTPVNDPPTVTLTGANPLNLTEGSVFVEPGAVGSDVEDGALTPLMSGTVDSGVLGTYILTYTVTDSASSTVSATRWVIVSAKSSESSSGSQGGSGGGNTGTGTGGGNGPIVGTLAGSSVTAVGGNGSSASPGGGSGPGTGSSAGGSVGNNPSPAPSTDLVETEPAVVPPGGEGGNGQIGGVGKPTDQGAPTQFPDNANQPEVSSNTPNTTQTASALFSGGWFSWRNGLFALLFLLLLWLIIFFSKRSEGEK